MRQFILYNAIGERYSLNDLKSFMQNPEGLGMERKVNYEQIGEYYVPISEELEQINQVVNRVLQLETEHREKQSNTFLTFLAVIASFSAIWDTNCLIDAIFNYESCFDVAIVGYRLITSVLLTIVFIVAIISKRKK